MRPQATNARQKVLSSAIATFARKGYAGTSVGEILRVTGLSKPTLYYYFENKAGLFRAILDSAYDESFHLMQAAAESEGCGEERMVAVITALFRFAEDNRDLIRLVAGTVFAAPEEIPRNSIDAAKRGRNFDFLAQLIRDAQKAGEIEARYQVTELTHGLFGAAMHLIRMHLLCPQGRLDRRRARRVVALFFDGARPRP